MNKKILHIITKLELGGAQINTLYTYNNLDKKYFSTYLLTGDKGILNNQVNNKENHKIIKSLVRAINPIKDFIALIKIISYIKQLKPDIVHTHSSKAGILGRIAARICKVPIIIHSVHGFAFSPNHSKTVNFIFIRIEKLISKITNHFIFVSKSDTETAKNLSLINNNYSLIRSGFSFEKFLNNRININKIKEKYKIPKANFVCGIIAPFKPQKGLLHLINIAEKVVKQYKNVTFIIAGDGKLRETMEEEIKNKKIMNNFILPGFIPDVENIISAFDIGISTALWEGLPQSLIQLRIMKKAVIASDIPGNTEIIKNNINGFTVNVQNYEEFSEKILSLIKDQALRERLQNHNDIFTEWNADFMVKKQEELYKKLLI